MTDNDYVRVDDDPLFGGRESESAPQRKSYGGSSTGKKLGKGDPYNLDFTELREQYVDSSSLKVPFIKSSFVHYSRCPRNLKINGHEYKDLIVTMEIIQAPDHLKYTQLVDPGIARKEALERRKAAAKEEKLAAKAAAEEKRRNDRIQSGGATDEDEDEKTEEEKSEDAAADDYGDSYGEDSYGGDDDSDDGDDDEDDDEYGGEDSDREYTGDMFKKTKGVKFAAASFEKLGEHNPRLSTNDYCNISIWSMGARLQRYTRLKNTILQVPPVECDQKFHVGNDAKRLYYLGQKDGQKKLVVVWLKDLTHNILDLGHMANQIETLEDSCLFKNYLSFAVKRPLVMKEKSRNLWRYTKDFYVFDLKQKSVVWELPDCEKVFFSGRDAALMHTIEFNDVKVKLRPDDEEPSEDEEEKDKEYDDGIPLKLEEVDNYEEIPDEDELTTWAVAMGNYGSGVMVVKTSIEDVQAEDETKKEEEKGLEQDAEKEKGEQDAAKMVTMKFFRVYHCQWKKPVNPKLLMYETKFEIKKNVIDEAPKGLLPAASEVSEGAKIWRLEENELLIVQDNGLSVLCMIVKGLKGEQHKVYTFNAMQKAPLTINARAGNTELEFNMNSNVRNYKQIFICQTESNGAVSAKQVTTVKEDDDEDSDASDDEQKAKKIAEKLPPITFTRPARGFVKDCWWSKVDPEDDKEIPLITTLCKSGTDDYLNADGSMSKVLDKKDEDGNPIFKTTRYSAKIKSQEIGLNYPCLVSNVGLNRITIQSVVNPDFVSTFDLDSTGMEFICFVDYASLNDIGFVDKRDALDKDLVPFSEAGDKIAFLARKFGVCENQCDKGDMLLNVLSIDSYSSPMKFELFTTDYEACMDEGMSDDSIQRCFCMQVTSARGLDVAFIAQYNDRIIFDCITSTKQLPLRFPLPANKIEEKEWKEIDPDFKKGDGDIKFEQLAVCKGATMVRQPMIQDKDGAAYFMMQAPGGLVQVMRTDPHIEMGADGFVKPVFHLRSSIIYFMLYIQGLFYIMDDTKKIRVLKPNAENYMWKQKTTYELPEKDRSEIVYADFDEFSISAGVLHYNDKMYFLLDSKSKDNATWASDEIMLDSHLHVCGPNYAKGSGLIWYMQKYATKIADQSDQKETDNRLDSSQVSLKPKNTFKGYSVVIQPLGDLSYVDLLPQRGDKNKQNFATFVTDNDIMINFSGRFLIFSPQGLFKGQVHFTGVDEGFRGYQVKLVNVSDSGKYFVFKGPRFLTKEEKEAKKKKKLAKKEAAKKNGDKTALNPLAAFSMTQKMAKKMEDSKSGGKKAPIFYIFKLDQKRQPSGEVQWRFVPYKTELFPFVDGQIMNQTTQRINHRGELSQCMIKSTMIVEDVVMDDFQVEVVVKNYKSQNPNAKQDDAAGGFLSFGSANLPQNPLSEERYQISFDLYQRRDKLAVLAGKIAAEQKRVSLGHGSKDNLSRLQRREQQIERAWVFDNYVVVKSGSQLVYVSREVSIFDGIAGAEPIIFDLAPGTDVWIENVFATGIEDLVQIFIIDDHTHRFYILTWNLQSNREHSLFQSTHAADVFPENLFMKGHSFLKQQNFNYFMDQTTIINLETNLPIQFFDPENESDCLPKGLFNSQVEGMRRVSSDWSRYLDITKPGRVHHFISYTDLLYWERFQLIKEKHEVHRGIISTFSPFARFPKGISVFHSYATNVKVLKTVDEAIQIQRQAKTEDLRVKNLPLIFLHSNPALNAPGKKTTPIHIALDKQSPMAFSTMFELLVEKTKVCVTSQLLDVMEPIINSTSPAVLEFFNTSFYITDQYDGLRAFEWQKEGDEMICATTSAYLTDEFLQTLVKNPDSIFAFETEEDFAPVVVEDGEGGDVDGMDAPIKYSQAVEPVAKEAEKSNIKQVEVKLLDFNWVFIGDNAARLLRVLSTTENDSIFAQAQIRVFVDFMWQGYYDAIFSQLFLPFICYFLSFILYTTYFAHHKIDDISFNFIMKIICLVVFGKTFVTMLILEIIKFRSQGWTYFLNLSSVTDCLSLILNTVYVIGQLAGRDEEELNVIAAVCLLLMWSKLYSWMKLFKPFSAFIRMISEICKDVQVFLVMLFISIGAFANIVMVLNLNRERDGVAPIFDAVIGFAPVDAVIHAFLTGLGEFGKDNYSEENSKVVWVMFILATLIVQLIFMNLLIAIMGSSYEKITGMMQQATLKEVCAVMVDHVWLQKTDELFDNKRYILWMTPDTSSAGGTIVERQILQLQEMVKSQSEQQEVRVLRAISTVNEDVNNLQTGKDNAESEVPEQNIDEKIEEAFSNMRDEFEMMLNDAVRRIKSKDDAPADDAKSKNDDDE